MPYQKPNASQCSTSSSPSTTTRGVHYAKHFPRSFISPYGQALGIMTDEKIINRLQFFTCEWLNRPDYAISEFSETMVKNMAVLEKYKGKIIPDKVVDVFSSNLEPIMDSLRRFDSKNTDAPGEPTVEDLAEVMKFLEGNDQLDSFMNRVLKHPEQCF
ncbi:hypothetical protein OS493_019878 [Desmophyllum pertusum]|uniref:Uncharacterized protein n=1 Tax=Desmophyllum pertusum TaxID=174260 RepID=A0A9W9YMW9_9CNID|nr:hypothetical protein OS493_019878 [Desmophyllum pertusum]